MKKDSYRCPSRCHDNDKNNRNNRRSGKTSLTFMEYQLN